MAHVHRQLTRSMELALMRISGALGLAAENVQMNILYSRMAKAGHYVSWPTSGDCILPRCGHVLP